MLHSTGNKELIIIGGPNGSGKTTLARELLKETEYEYVSADDIAYELNPQDPLTVRLEAGKEFFKRLDRFANDGTNLLIESTLSGKSL
jgi:predicted ABC-type ATPase